MLEDSNKMFLIEKWGELVDSPSFVVTAQWESPIYDEYRIHRRLNINIDEYEEAVFKYKGIMDGIPRVARFMTYYKAEQFVQEFLIPRMVAAKLRKELV